MIPSLSREIQLSEMKSVSIPRECLFYLFDISIHRLRIPFSRSRTVWGEGDLDKEKSVWFPSMPLKCISQKDPLVTFPDLSAPSNSSEIGARSGAYSFVDLNHHLEMEDMQLVCPLPLLRVEQLCPCYSLIVTSGSPKRIVNTKLVWADQWLLDSMASSTLDRKMIC